MNIDVARIFLGILEAINFLHAHRWVHRDIKRENIGLVGHPPRPLLLDLGGAIHLARAGEKVKPVPGAGGTVGYLAPERELFPYDAAVDVWAAGVVGFELARGRHPWRFSLNPWREGDVYERERDKWEYKYFEAMESLQEAARAVPSKHAVIGEWGCVAPLFFFFLSWTTPLTASAVEPLIKQMLHYPFAQRPEDTKRITVADALAHRVWLPLREPPKRHAQHPPLPLQPGSAAAGGGVQEQARSQWMARFHASQPKRARKP
jgi:serine/threonine protein kinase